MRRAPPPRAAGRDLGIIVTALAVFSSTLSGFGFVGGPGLVYRMGMSSLWMVVCASIGYVIAFYLLGKRLRLFAELRDSISLPDAVAARYRSGIGLVMRALVLQGGHPELPGADAAAPQFLQAFTHPLLAGVVFAGLFAAIMSTADGFLNIGAAAVIHDIPRAILGRSLRNELLWARIVTVIIAVAAALFALYSGQNLVALLGAFGWGTFGIDGGALSLLVSLTLFFGISLLSRPPKLDRDIAAVMDM